MRNDWISSMSEILKAQIDLIMYI